MKLNRHGRLIDSPNNKFEIRGTVIIGGKTYEGLLLEGKPTAFGADVKAPSSAKNLEMFDLNMRITGGELAQAFGNQRVFADQTTGQEHIRRSIHDGFFQREAVDQPADTSRKPLPASISEPTPLITFLTCGAGLLAYRLRRYLGRKSPRRGNVRELMPTEDLRR